MDSRERVLAAVHLEEPDRVPISPSGFHETALRRLFDYFHVNEKMALYQRLGLDAVIVSVGDGVITFATRLGPKKLPDGSLINEWGMRYIVPPDRDQIFVGQPLERLDDLDSYVLPDPDAPGRFDELQEIEGCSQDYALVGSIDFGLFEKACLLRGFDRFLKDLHSQPAFVHKLLDRLTEFDLKLVDQLCRHEIDIFFGSDDFGTQTSLMISPQMFKEFFRDRWMKLIRTPKSKRIPVMLHSDGNVEGLISEFLSLGVDILNPVQPRAINPALVKAKYGDKLAQYGTIDIQRTLPFGSPQEVEQEVRTRMMTVGFGGGLVLAPSHTLLPDVPLENYLAFIKAAKKFGRYTPA